MMLVFALIGLVGILGLIVCIACGLSSSAKNATIWIVFFCICLGLVTVSWIGGTAIQDIEEAAHQEQEHQYEYNYCPYCGEQLKGE